MFPFAYTAFAVSGKVGISFTGLTTQVWWLSLPQIDRPKSVRNCCVSEVFGGVCVLSRCFLDFSVGVGAFVIGLSLISLLFSCKYVPIYMIISASLDLYPIYIG